MHQNRKNSWNPPLFSPFLFFKVTLTVYFTLYIYQIKKNIFKLIEKITTLGSLLVWFWSNVFLIPLMLDQSKVLIYVFFSCFLLSDICSNNFETFSTLFPLQSRILQWGHYLLFSWEFSSIVAILSIYKVP